LVVDLDLIDHLVGRTRYCIHPADRVASVAKVGGTKKIHLDKIRALQPTHVLVNIDENTREMADALREFVPHLVVTHPQTPLDNLGLFELFGAIFNRRDQAQRLCDAFAQAHRRLTNAARDWASLRVLYLIWRNPWMTISRNTYVSQTLAAAGMVSEGHDAETRYPEVEVDARLIDEVDAILFSSEPFPFKDADLAAFCENFPGSRHKVATIDGEMISWYASRAIAPMDYLRRFRDAPSYISTSSRW